MLSQIIKLKEENTLKDFHWITRKLVAAIGYGHTSINGRNEERKFSDALHFPLGSRFVNDHLYIVTDLSQFDNLTTGTEIISINGRSSKAMLYNMMQRVSSDGLK